MKDDRTASPSSDRSSFAWMLWPCFILFVVYPLSTGPVWRLCKAFDLDSNYSVRIVLYAPMIALCSAFDPLNDFVNWYLGLWGVP